MPRRSRPAHVIAFLVASVALCSGCKKDAPASDDKDKGTPTAQAKASPVDQLCGHLIGVTHMTMLGEDLKERPMTLTDCTEAMSRMSQDCANAS